MLFADPRLGDACYVLLEEVFIADEGADPVFEVVGDGEDNGVAVGADFAQDGPVGDVGDGGVLGGGMCVEFLAY
ncbi:hypothetical protein BJ965_006996 [Streptomyces luteogriseus]|uniref:Uncharacterized protein n=1 Tax=Streptomyces luteogriseus TaxID=68233 RepID=A0A7W7DUD9_9ACTN|nr:hypothetical protein [Streptomyces luteogriseus]MBB4717114.1 hypothetical protein [Streptomyces luteogriseus]